MMGDARKQAIKLQLRRAERQEFLRGLPLPADSLMQLLNETAELLEEWDCDHTFRHFEAACRNQAIEPAASIGWLRERGHACDCEAVDNVTGWLEDALKEAPGPSIQ